MENLKRLDALQGAKEEILHVAENLGNYNMSLPWAQCLIDKSLSDLN